MLQRFIQRLILSEAERQRPDLAPIFRELRDCRCRPVNGYHSFVCPVSRRHRAEQAEAGTPPERPDPNRQARAWVTPAGS